MYTDINFKTKLEAKAYADDLMWRWLLVREIRVVRSGEAANYAWANGQLTAVDTPLDTML